MKAKRASKAVIRSRVLVSVAFVITAAVLACVGYWYYRIEKGEIAQENFETLAAIGELKAEQIERWRNERLAEVGRVAQDDRIVEAASKILEAREAPNFRKVLRELLNKEARGQGLFSVDLFGVDGSRLDASGEDIQPADAATIKAMREALATNKPTFSDFYRNAEGVLQIDVTAPVRRDDGEPLGVLVLSHDAAAFLDPLVQPWPAPSASAESYLVARDGAEAVYLNDLRHRQGAALTLRKPLEEVSVSGVAAVLGRQGMFEGIDYRGVKVLSDLRPIPASPWFIVSEIDEEEVFADAGYRSMVFTLIAGLIILLAGGAVASAYRQRQVGILNTLLEAERQMAKEKRASRILAENMKDVVWTLDPETLRFLYVSPSVLRLRGFTAEEIIAEPMDAAMTPESSEYVRRVMRGRLEEFLASGVSSGPFYTDEVEQPCKGGTTVWTEVVTNFYRNEETGRVEVLGVTRDITDRRRAEEERRKREDIHRGVLHAAMDGFCMSDTEERIREVNPSYCSMIGYSEQELLKMGISDVEAQETKEDVSAHIQKIRTMGGARFETRHKRKDGRIIDIEVSTQSRPEIGMFVSFFRDITDRKKTDAKLREALDRAEAASRAKSEFLGVMSHELRTPLNGVLGFAELLADSNLDEEQTEFVRTILSSGNHLLQVVNDILDFSDIEQGGLRLEMGPVALAELVESAIAVVRQSAKDKGLGLRCEIAPETPKIIRGDALRIRQILINLLGNAVKFTSSGSVAVKIAPVLRDGRHFVEYAVVDTGVGISAESMTTLFEPFTQADSTHSRRYGGTGLGLAISRRLAKAMGGDIAVESLPGSGSTFTLRLPCEGPDPGPAREVPSREPSARPHQVEVVPPRPVLIVEDDRASMMLAGKFVSLFGYDVEFAADGREAIEAYVPGKYLAILMDMQTPGINGIEATVRIRAMEKEAGAPRVPIIAITANVMPGDREKCIDAGMDDFLAKPLDRNELAQKLAEIARRA